MGRRREILDAAARLFRERGYDGTSLEDVAGAVGVSKGALYHHFPSKSVLLAEILEEAVDALPVADTVPELLEAIARLDAERRDQLTVLFGELRSDRLPPADARRISGKLRAYFEDLEGVLRAGTDEATFRALAALAGILSRGGLWHDGER